MYLTRLKLAAILLLCATGAFGANSPPNILLLMAEDLSPRLGSYGDLVADTPNLDRLAMQGVRYTHVFTTAGVCAPSRAALITGQHQIAFGGQHMRTSTSPLGEYYAQPAQHVKAFPELLRRAGYYTFTDNKLDYQFSGIRAGSGPFSIWDAEGPGSHWRNRPAGQPFFGMLNLFETHESGVMRPTGAPHSEVHRRTQIMRQQIGVAEAVTNPETVVLPSYYPDVPEVRADLARHYDNIRQMDQRVGRILAELRADRLLSNTVVIWTTDHGDGLPRAKRELYDSGLQVPMLLRLPDAWDADRGAGTVDERLVSFVDLAPSILSLAGVPVPEYVHGSSFLEGDRRFVFASRDRIDEVPDRQRAVRDRRYKYIRSWHPDTPGGHPLEYRDNLDMVRAMRRLYLAGELNDVQARWFQGPGTEQLYDTANDPEEVVNLVNRPAFQQQRKRLAAALDQWLETVGDTGAIPETALRAAFLPDNRVPVTPKPTVQWQGQHLFLQAEHGASIGYRLDAGPWLLYREPLAIASSAPLQVKAVRYGWRESVIVDVRMGQTIP